MIPDRFLKRVSICLITWLLSSTSAYNSFAFARPSSDECKQPLTRAEHYYREGFFERAIKLILSSGFEQDCSEPEKAMVYKLLAKLFLAKDYSVRARLAVEKMLESDAGIVLDPATEPPPLLTLYAEVVNEHRREKKPSVTKSREEEDKGGSKILPLVLGGVAGSVVALLALSGGDQPQETPGVQNRGFPQPVGRPAN